MRGTHGKKNSLALEIEDSLRLIKENGYGSVEIYVQAGVVTQITVRNIRKTKLDIKNGKLREALHG